MAKKVILSIQGGGIRGIIPACVLISLEKFTGKLTREVVSFCGGTSTGALLTAAVASGVPAQKSLDIYLNDGRKIFSPTWDVERTVKLVAQGFQFDNKVLASVLAGALGPVSANCTINSFELPLLVIAADQLGDAQYFTQDRGTNASRYGGYKLFDAAVASACATTYHAPWMVPGLGWCADGGCVSDADPVYQTCVEAFTGYRCYGDIDPKEVLVLSLGTGYFKPATQPKPPSGLLAGIQWVTSALVGSSITIAEQAVLRHWPGVLVPINAPLPIDVDEAGVDAIPTLLDIGQKLAASVDWATVLA